MKLANYSDQAVQYCEKLGADEAEAYVQTVQTIEVVLERAEIQNERVKKMQGIGIRAIKDKKLGFAFTSSVDKGKMQEACRSALSLASVSLPNQDWVSLPEPQKLPKSPMGIFDKKAADAGAEEVISLVTRAYDEAKAYDERVEIDDGKFSVFTYQAAVSNSHGVEAEGKKTLLVGSLVCVAREGGETSSAASEYDVSTSLKDFSPERVGRLAAEKAVASLKPKAVASFDGKCILDPTVASAVLVQPIISSINADNVQKSRSLWSNRLGQEVAVANLTLIDDGLLSKGIGSSSFDSEGVPCQKTLVIESGTLLNFLYDSFSAHKENKKSTGNGHRAAYSQLPSITVSNLIIKAGTKRLDELISEVDKGILVKRFSGNVRQESGEFSGIAKQASYIEGGEIKHCLKETMISGNAFQAIKYIIEIGSEIRPTQNQTYVPPMLVDKMTIVSK